MLERESSNRMVERLNFEIVGKPCNVSRSFCEILAGLGSALAIHVFPLSSNASRWVNGIKNAENLPSKEHIESFNSWTVSVMDPKHALIGALWKAVSGIIERVRELRLIKAEKWVSARRSAASKVFNGVWGYVRASSRDVTRGKPG